MLTYSYSYSIGNSWVVCLRKSYVFFLPSRFFFIKWGDFLYILKPSLYRSWWTKLFDPSLANFAIIISPTPISITFYSETQVQGSEKYTIFIRLLRVVYRCGGRFYVWFLSFIQRLLNKRDLIIFLWNTCKVSRIGCGLMSRLWSIGVALKIRHVKMFLWLAMFFLLNLFKKIFY